MALFMQPLRRATRSVAGGLSQLKRGIHSSGSSSKKHSVLAFNGDGIGGEIVACAQRVIEAAGVNIDWHSMEFGYEAKQNSGVYVTEDHLQAFEEYKVLLKGPLTIPPGEKTYIDIRDRRFTSGNQVFRKVYQLFANVRPARNWPGVKSPVQGVDLVVIRENTEDVYLGKEQWVDEDTVECIKQISRGASKRIAEFAFDYAEKNGRKHVTCVHKANVCKQSDGLFLSTFNEVAKERGEGFVCDDQLADSLLTKLVLAPQDFDMLVCPNLYGDMTSDLAGGLIGSLGLCPSGNFGENQALFEAAHGSAPDIAGQGIANPSSMILSACMMLQHLNEHKAADAIVSAMGKTFADGVHPIDLGGKASSNALTEAIIDRL